MRIIRTYRSNSHESRLAIESLHSGQLKRERIAMSQKLHNAYMAYITCSFNDLYYYGVYSLSTEYRVELYCFRIPVQTTNTPSLQGESSSNIRRGRIGTTQSKDPEKKCSGVFVAWQKMCPSDSPCMLYHWNDTKPETEKQVSFDTYADYYYTILLRCLILLR